MSNSEPSAIVLHRNLCIGGLYIRLDSGGENGSLKVRRKRCGRKCWIGAGGKELLLAMLLTVCIEAGRRTLTYTSWTVLAHRSRVPFSQMAGGPPLRFLQGWDSARIGQAQALVRRDRGLISRDAKEPAPSAAPDRPKERSPAGLPCRCKSAKPAVSLRYF